MSYTDKYAQGAITNSMLEAAEACEYKFFVLYLERAKLALRYKKILDAMSLGILVHEVLEAFPRTMMSVTPLQAVLTSLSDWPLDANHTGFIQSYLNALDATRADGLRKGKTYTAPTWTSFWKANYGQLDANVAEFNRNLSRPDWLCDIQPMDFILRAVTAVQNYKDLLPTINAGYVFQAAEQTFHVSYGKDMLAGTLDRSDMDPEAQGLVLTDYKTGSKKYSTHILLNLNQLNLYAYAKRANGQAVTGLRVVALERNEIIEVPFNEKAHQIYMKDRLPRLIHKVKQILETPRELLSVLAGRSFDIGCPCSLAQLLPGDPNQCTSVYMENK